MKKKKITVKLKSRKITKQVHDEIMRIWKKHTKNILDTLKIDLQTGKVTIESDEDTTKALMKDLKQNVDTSYSQLNKKFVSLMEAEQKKHTKYQLPEIDRSELQKNKQVYDSYKKNLEKHIMYFKKFPKYVKLKSQEYVDELVKELKKAREEISFDAQKVAQVAAKIEGVSERHAAFIARDQLGKFAGALNQAQDQYAGSTEYIWRTMKDNRVRHEHEELEGKRFSYKKPPPCGHPGKDYQCRCTAEALFECFEKMFEEKKAA
jgi:SPP1 gp7 family putative phage head morphogenesis protein